MTTMLSERDFQRALALTPRFYQACLDFELWPPILEELVYEFGARVAQVNLADVDPMAVVASATYGASTEAIQRFLAVKDHRQIDPRIPMTLSMLNRPFHDRQLMPIEEWRETIFFKEILEPYGLQSQLAALTFLENENLYAILGLIRGVDQDAFNDYDIQKYHLYLPHFRESMRISSRVRQIDFRANIFRKVFDLARIAILVVDRFGRIHYTNGSGENLLKEHDGLVSRGGKLFATSSEADAELQSAILRSCVANAGGGQEARKAVALPRRESRPSLLATLASINDHSDLRATTQGILLSVLFVSDPTQKYESDEETLQRLFGLTAAEAKVMTAIMNGQSPREIAEDQKKSYETVRTHLKQVFSKTGTKSQADLIRLASQYMTIS